MKKTLALLTLSLLMIASLIIGVNATISDDDIGFYVRFDSQEKVEQYASGTSMYIVYDSDVNALRFSSKVTLPITSTTDWNFYLNFGKSVDFANYPYMRITYMSPKTGINGEATSSKSNVYLYPGAPTADFQAVITMNTGKDSWHKTLVNWNNVTDNRTNGSKDLNRIRMDFPKGIAGYYEFYIYDVGFFATQEAAYSYKPEQSFAMIDFSDPYYATDAAWKNKSGYTLEYDKDNEALKFLNTNVTGDQEGKNGDRIRGQAFSPLNYFSASQYNHVSTKYKTNDGYAMYFLHTGYYMSTNEPYTGSGTEKAYNAKNNLSMEVSTDKWKIASGPLTLIADDAEEPDLSKTVVQFFADVINDNGSGTQNKWRTVKYVAYYSTAEEAKLETQAAPKNLVATAPTAKDGKGTISGVTTAMEYRASDSAYNVYTPITEDDNLAVDAGKTYYIRYKAVEGTSNPGYAAAVSVPMYWNLDITAVKYSDGETVYATINKTDNQTWKITVPKGTNLTKLVPVYTFESGATEKYKNNANGEKSREASLWVSADNSNAKKLVSGTTAFGDNFDENNKIQLHIYQTYSLFDVVNVEFVEPEVDDNTVVNGISEAIENAIIKSTENGTTTLTNYGHHILLAKENADDIKTAIQTIADKYASRYNGVNVTVSVSEYEAFIAGTVDKTEGADGSCVVSWTVTKGGASKDFSNTLPVPAAHYRIILNFGSPLVEGTMSVYSTKKNENDEKSTPNLTTKIIADVSALGGAYMRITKDDNFGSVGEFNISFTPGSSALPEIGQLADYPVIVYRDRQSVNGNYQIFYSTDGGASMAYQGKWKQTGESFTETIWKTAFEGGINSDINDCINADWANKLKSLRLDFMRSSDKKGKSIDIDYIGFFATEADAQAFIEDPKLDDDTPFVETLGAQIRADKDDEVALRFGVKVNVGEGMLVNKIASDLDKTKTITYDDLKVETTLTGLKFGTLIVPADKLDDKELAFENLTVNEGKEVNEGKYTINNVEVADVACNNIYKVDNDSFTYTAVVYKIGDRDTELVARPYAKYTVGGVEKVVYFDSITRSYDNVKKAFEANNNLGWDK